MQRTWVIKIGSSLLTDHGVALNHQAINAWCSQISGLVELGIRPVLVSSGAVAAGVSTLGWQSRPTDIHQLQAAAAVGQVGLLAAYSQAMQSRMPIAQVLLDHDDFSRRDRYLNARSTLLTLLQSGVLPIVNENDTVATDEIRFGDNDSLAALVANLVDAERLVILTDQVGLFDADPRNNPMAKLIDEAQATDERLLAMAGGAGSAVGTGGMATKVIAAQIAAKSATDTHILDGRVEQALLAIARGQSIGTRLIAEGDAVSARKRWLTGQLRTKGRVTVDAGAANALLSSEASLLSVGVISVKGDFLSGDLVQIVDSEGVELGRGLSNYSRAEADQLAGIDTRRLKERLGYDVADEMVHRDNLVISG